MDGMNPNENGNYFLHFKKSAIFHAVETNGKLLWLVDTVQLIFDKLREFFNLMQRLLNSTLITKVYWILWASSLFTLLLFVTYSAKASNYRILIGLNRNRLCLDKNRQITKIRTEPKLSLVQSSIIWPSTTATVIMVISFLWQSRNECNTKMTNLK